MRSLMLSVGAFFAIEAASPVAAAEDPNSRNTDAASTSMRVGDVNLSLIPPLKLCITCWPGWG